VNVRRGLEKFNVEADPTDRWGRPALQGKGSDRSTQQFHRGRDDGMDRRNTYEPRETGGNSGGPALAAREGQSQVAPVAERPVVAWKPGNAGGAKGPQFKDQRRQESGRR
jgi:hypothetical protein